ncbi:MAG: ATP-binding cassette domain-containing protein [Betaproteobacteria bacterium]
MTREFGGVRALDGVSLEVAPGEQVCVIGPNGCGKTTLFNVITAQLPPSSGEVALNGRPLVGLAPHHVARLGVARKFQVPSVFEDLTVQENLEVACFGLPPSTSSSSSPPDLSFLLQQIQLADRAQMPAGRLPHGARQWLEIGMLLAQAPRLLLLDEPTAGMTGAETLATAALVRRLAEQSGTAVVVVEHDMRFVQALGARVVVMLAGRVVADGLFDEVRRLPQVREAYLGAHA